MKIVLIILAAIYALSPYDVIPESLLGWLGYLDDLVLIYFLWKYFKNMSGRRQAPSDGRRADEESFRGNRRSSASDAAEPYRPADPYTVLEIEPGASREEIKKAYRRLASQYHPDKVQHLGEDIQALAEKRFKEIQEAYQELSSR